MTMELAEYEESGLRFRFPPEHLFKPDAVPQKGRQGVKGCDFIWHKSSRKVWVVEVKRSAPQSAADLHVYLNDLLDKFTHSLLLWLARGAGRHIDIDIPEALSNPGAYRANPRCILVVAELSDSALGSLHEALQQQLRPICRAFDMPPAMTMGAERAAKHFILGQVANE